MMNMEKFNSFSEEDQKIFTDAAWACAKAEYESYKDMLSDAESFFDAHEITAISLRRRNWHCGGNMHLFLMVEKLVGDDLYSSFRVSGCLTIRRYRKQAMTEARRIGGQR